MPIYLNHHTSVQDKPRVTLNPGVAGGQPFAVVELNEDGAYMTAGTHAECDAMIEAWREARSLLPSEPVPPAEAKPTCLSRKPGTSTSCQRPAGHSGGHKNYAKDDYWPQESAEDDAGRAIVADLGAKEQAALDAAAGTDERGVSEYNREEFARDRGDGTDAS